MYKYRIYIIHTFYILLFLIFLLFEFPCPILYFCNIPCPTCGVTRAMFALLNLDFAMYIYYQPFAAFLITAILLFIHCNILSHKELIKTYCISIVFINYLYYILKIFMQLKKAVNGTSIPSTAFLFYYIYFSKISLPAI